MIDNTLIYQSCFDFCYLKFSGSFPRTTLPPKLKITAKLFHGPGACRGHDRAWPAMLVKERSFQTKFGQWQGRKCATFFGMFHSIPWQLVEVACKILPGKCNQLVIHMSSIFYCVGLWPGHTSWTRYCRFFSSVLAAGACTKSLPDVPGPSAKAADLSGKELYSNWLKWDLQILSDGSGKFWFESIWKST